MTIDTVLLRYLSYQKSHAEIAYILSKVNYLVKAYDVKAEILHPLTSKQIMKVALNVAMREDNSMQLEINIRLAFPLKFQWTTLFIKSLAGDA